MDAKQTQCDARAEFDIEVCKVQVSVLSTGTMQGSTGTPMYFSNCYSRVAIIDAEYRYGIGLVPVAMYRRRGRPSTRNRSAPAEMPEQAGPSAPPDLRDQLAALTEATRQQGALLQRMCETFTPPPSTAPRAPEKSAPPPTIPMAAPAAAVPHQ
uniref:Uncharacterized protein n=1 Tax=Ananas comosus var. bracteatus TaxID=296719 RepID=A0A6V7QI28_ANACO|nr:unnamed protein product [Ananas comosus var. bracteatus]